jgi:hypothetical protein
MKMKTLATLAVSGLMAASFAYVVPAFADDSDSIDGSAPMQLAMGEDTGNAAAPETFASNSSENATNNTSNSVGNLSDNSSTANVAGAQPAQGNESGTPDVASGDDDY